MRTTLRVTAGLLALCAFAALPFPAQAQTTANGPYYATPSWDQTLPSSTRFIILSNFNSEAALDRETGLVWDRFAGGIADWTGARNTCVNKVVGGRVGWRLPSVQELATLMDPLVSIGTRLPAGHPFVAFSDSIYWSATVDTDNSAAAWIAIFSSTLGTPQVTTIGKVKENTFHYLCVRGGGPLDRH